MWGDGDDGCEHEWGTETRKKQSPQRDHDKSGGFGDTRGQEPSRAGMSFDASQGQFCQRCSAWRGCLGLEPTPEMFCEHIVEVFRCVKRVLRDDATCWVNLGDSYAATQGGRQAAVGELPKDGKARRNKRRNIKRTDVDVGGWGERQEGASVVPPAGCGLKPKDLIGIPWRCALALQADGWYLRSAMPWVKRNPMPESCTDRPASALEYVFLLSKRVRYFWDAEAVRQKAQYGYCPTVGDHAGSIGGTHATRTVTPGDGSGGRAFRNTDLYYESLKPPHGMIHVGDEPVGLDVCPEAFPGAYCTGCQRYYGRGVRHLPKHTDRQGKKHPICPCGQWSKWLSHFATFPRKLAAAMIKAGTSQKGCCPECGAAWRRVVEKDRRPTRPGRNNVSDETGMANRDEQRHVTESRTVGWKPGCTCCTITEVISGCTACSHQDGEPCTPPKPVPCTVIDIFMGAGTVGVVAKQLGRSFIGCEINPDYAEMARKRIANPEPEPEVVDVEGQMELFPSPCMTRKDMR